jgi:hypothetical protein
MEERMGRPSSISSTRPESTPPVYIPPRLTEAQQSVMNVLFAKQLGRTMKNWNLFPATDPIWKRCISILLTEMQKSASEEEIAKREVEVLTQQIIEGGIKRFFCKIL